MKYWIFVQKFELIMACHSTAHGRRIRLDAWDGACRLARGVVAQRADIAITLGGHACRFLYRDFPPLVLYSRHTCNQILRQSRSCSETLPGQMA
jgi:hypothetical protein